MSRDKEQQLYDELKSFLELGALVGRITGDEKMEYMIKAREEQLEFIDEFCDFVAMVYEGEYKQGVEPITLSQAKALAAYVSMMRQGLKQFAEQLLSMKGGEKNDAE